MPYLKRIDSPVGRLDLHCHENGLTAVDWHCPSEEVTEPNESAHPILIETANQLQEYFDGKRTTFSLPLDLRGTSFQQKVWAALLDIPFGETRTYGDIAKQIGNPKSVRAIGGASHQNPIPIIVPCHRVIGATGKLVGFGGGIETKSRLLALEIELTGNGSRLHYRQQELFPRG